MPLDKIKYFYWKKGLSTREVGKLLGISQWSVISKMRKYKIPRRKPAETLRIQFKKSPLSFNKKITLTAVEAKLYSAGLMLYWAEGAKAQHGIVDFSNCNKQMILLFLSVLRKIYRVQESRIRVLLYCYANQKVESLIDFWSRELKILKSQFTKPYVRNDFKFAQIDKMPFGLVHVRYNDKRLHKQILEDIDKIAFELS